MCATGFWLNVNQAPGSCDSELSWRGWKKVGVFSEFYLFTKSVKILETRTTQRKMRLNIANTFTIMIHILYVPIEKQEYS